MPDNARLERIAYAHRPGQTLYVTACVVAGGPILCDNCEATLPPGAGATLGGHARPSIGRRVVYCQTCRPYHVLGDASADCGWCRGERPVDRRTLALGRKASPRTSALRDWALTAVGRALLTHGCEDDPTGCLESPNRRCLLYNALAALVSAQGETA